MMVQDPLLRKVACIYHKICSETISSTREDADFFLKAALNTTVILMLVTGELLEIYSKIGYSQAHGEVFTEQIILSIRLRQSIQGMVLVEI